MTDIVAELRRLLDEAPPGRWEVCGEPGWVDIWGNDGDLYHLDYIEGDDTNLSPLIVAMHNAFPALLDAIDTLRWYADIFNYDDDDCPVTTFYHPDGDMDCEADRGTKAREALAALERSER